MKRLLPLLTLALLATTASAFMRDEETLFNEDDTWNMYSKLGVSYSDIGNDDGFWGTIEAGGLLNNKLALGLRVTTLGQSVSPGFEGYDNPGKFDITYAGLATEYTVWAEKLVHTSLGLFIGGGQLRLDHAVHGNDDDIGMFVLEPEVNVMVNVTPRSEIGLGLGYRSTDLHSSNLDDGDLSGLVGTIFLRLTNN